MDNLKIQIADSLKKANNVLVTVSNNPSVDQLAAAIGLTLLLNKLGKHSTAVFSGAVPSIIEFLEPEKTLEKTTDSLRDFIIALDKSKADKLRYKVEDKLVKIFITPYRTSIGEHDLEFSQGDFNVDAVVALGVRRREELDQAITAHGRILHDATIISVNLDGGSDVGTLNLVDSAASSLCEIVVAIANLISSKPDLFDAQMATAFMTGIVAETDRFRNAKTSASTMTFSAKLMAAGANQQLVADKLEPAISVQNNGPARVSQPAGVKVSGEDGGSVKIDHNQTANNTAGSSPSDNSGKIDHNNSASQSQPLPNATNQTLPSPSPARISNQILPPQPSLLPMQPPQPSQQSPFPPRQPLPTIQSRPSSTPYLIRPLPWQDPVQAATDPVPDNMAAPTEPTSATPTTNMPMMNHNESASADSPVIDQTQNQAPGQVVPVAPGGTPVSQQSTEPPTLEELEEFVKSPHLKTKAKPVDANAVSPVIPTPFVYVANSSSKQSTPASEIPTAPYITPDQASPVTTNAANEPPLPPITALNANPINLDLGHDDAPTENPLPNMTVDVNTGVPEFNVAEPEPTSTPPPPLVPPPLSTDASQAPSGAPPGPPPMMPPAPPVL